MGWLGWTERQALCTDVNSIVIAYQGRVDMFKVILEAVTGKKPPTKKRLLNAQFRDFAKAHNASFKKRKEKRK